MLVPADTSPLSRAFWGVIISYEENGYVKDKDAAKINYDELLKQIRKGAQASNKEREKQGYPPIEIVGWAAPPNYDQSAHKLHWAKEVRFGNETENTLNYNIRILGRRGVLVLNSVAGMSQLPEIQRNTPAILSAVNFNSWNRCARRRRRGSKAWLFQRAMGFDSRSKEICHYRDRSRCGLVSQAIWQKGHTCRIDH